MAVLLRSRRLPAALALTKQQTRSQSLLSAIFGIGEFEGARNQSLGAGTSKRHAFDLALLEVSSWSSRFLCTVADACCSLTSVSWWGLVLVNDSMLV